MLTVYKMDKKRKKKKKKIEDGGSGVCVSVCVCVCMRACVRACVWCFFFFVCGDVFLCPYNHCVHLITKLVTLLTLLMFFSLPRLSLFAPKNNTGDIAVFFHRQYRLCVGPTTLLMV